MKLLSTLICALLIFVNSNVFAQLETEGTWKRLPNFPSQHVDPRNIDIWLPSDYSRSKKYAVLYMHDGQMLFDAKRTWNGQEWGVDEAMSELQSQGLIRDCIIVGIWNNGKKRGAEYFPSKVFEQFTKSQQDSFLSLHRENQKEKIYSQIPLSDKYLKFIVEELKPYIDKTFSVEKDKQSTFIAGSSMGGLISLYAALEYPNVFGAAACLSTHWIGGFDESAPFVSEGIINYVKVNLKPENNQIFYLDRGNVGLDANYKNAQQKIDAIFRNKNFPEKNWKSVVIEGADHSENSWQSRFPEIAKYIIQPL